MSVCVCEEKGGCEEERLVVICMEADMSKSVSSVC